MSNNRNIKKIDVQTLDNIDKKSYRKLVKKAFFTLVVFISIAAAGWGANKIFADEILETRFIVNKMNCSGCIGKVKNACAIPGVVDAEVSLASQTAFIRYNEKQTNPETIRAAMNNAGFPAENEGTFRSGGKSLNEPVAAVVNGRPIFKKDMGLSLWKDIKQQDMADNFYDLVMMQTLLKEAEAARIFAHPIEIQQEADKQRKSLNMSSVQMMSKAVSDHGSMEKYIQVVGNKLGVRKIAQKILSETKDTDEKKAVIAKWLAERFKVLDVKILDKDLQNNLSALTGADTWEKSWPHMINRETAMTKAVIN